MPIHDWTRVNAGTFHAFHSAWIVHLQEALNGGTLPQGYYALAEQRAGEIGPDVLTLESQTNRPDSSQYGDEPLSGSLAVAEHPPQVQWSAETELAHYLERQRSLVIRHATGDRIVALVEIVSPANKATRANLDSFLDKALAALRQHYHLLIVDLHPPGTHDPQGIHGALWSELGELGYLAPEDAPLTLAAYSAGEVTRAYVEPTAVGRVLAEMPLFLMPHRYVKTPLEETYLASWRGMPQRWREVIAPDEQS
jgi:hypothetical protein